MASCLCFAKRANDGLLRGSCFGYSAGSLDGLVNLIQQLCDNARGENDATTRQKRQAEGLILNSSIVQQEGHGVLSLILFSGCVPCPGIGTLVVHTGICCAPVQLVMKQNLEESDDDPLA